MAGPGRLVIALVLDRILGKGGLERDHRIKVKEKSIGTSGFQTNSLLAAEREQDQRYSCSTSSGAASTDILARSEVNSLNESPDNSKQIMFSLLRSCSIYRVSHKVGYPHFFSKCLLLDTP